MVYENKQDWPEKYDINKLVTRQDAIDKIINGEKTTERRNDRYADAGDEIILDGQTFIVNDIYPQQLKTLTDENGQVIYLSVKYLIGRVYMTKLMKDKSGLVTVAGSGIGRASAIALAKAGAKVMVSDVNEDAVKRNCKTY